MAKTKQEKIPNKKQKPGAQIEFLPFFKKSLILFPFVSLAFPYGHSIFCLMSLSYIILARLFRAIILCGAALIALRPLFYDAFRIAFILLNSTYAAYFISLFSLRDQRVRQKSGKSGGIYCFTFSYSFEEEERTLERRRKRSSAAKYFTAVLRDSP